MTENQQDRLIEKMGNTSYDALRAGLQALGYTISVMEIMRMLDEISERVESVDEMFDTMDLAETTQRRVYEIYDELEDAVLIRVFEEAEEPVLEAWREMFTNGMNRAAMEFAVEMNKVKTENAPSTNGKSK